MKPLYPWQLATANEHPTAPARGGKQARRVRRAMSGARELGTRKHRHRGPSGSSAGLGMRPPGSGPIGYQRG